jgi:hypothetical protein
VVFLFGFFFPFLLGSLHSWKLVVGWERNIILRSRLHIYIYIFRCLCISLMFLSLSFFF